jgi:nitrogen fixation/metabolism regulation signal transduction histidine kinase
MLNGVPVNISLYKKLIIMMLFMSFISITALVFLYSQSERSLFRELERQTKELTKAIQIGVEEVTSSGATDEARLSKYLNDLNTKGVKEISIISNADEIVASSNLEKIGQPLTHKRKELIIKAELGEPVSEEGSTYNVIVPVIAGNTQYGYIHLKINKDDFSRVLKENTIKRIGATIFVFGLGIIMALVLSRRYTRPIMRVVDAAQRVAAGDLNMHIPVNARDEIGQLSESFNFMVQKLKEMRTLEEKLREAEHLSGIGILSRNIAHEIRNPLNFINLSIDHISEKYKPDGKENQAVFLQLTSGIKQEIRRLNTLVTDFLDYSKPLKLSLQRVKIENLMEEVIALVWAKADADGVAIVKDYSENIEINVDVDLFKTCVLNVISNAFHSLEEGGRHIKEKQLTIKTEISGNDFILTISDNGAGIPPEHMERIFEPFFTTKQHGIGIGLPMTKRVIEEHGGKVRFESSVGFGTVVKLMLPA